MLKENPAIYSLLTDQILSSCFRCLKQCSKGCRNCRQIFYCDSKCQKEDWKWHKYECSGFENEMQNIDAEARIHIRAIISFKYGYSSFKDYFANDQNPQKLASLYIKCTSILHSQISFDDFKKLSQQLDTNILGITNEMIQNVGVGLFPMISVLNHSCIENTLFYFKEKTIHVVASRDINPGEEITTRYVPFSMNLRHRKLELRNWGFLCDCDLVSF